MVKTMEDNVELSLNTKTNQNTNAQMNKVIKC